MYEMVAGIPPFYHEDRVTMFKNICHLKYSFPAHFSRVIQRNQLYQLALTSQLLMSALINLQLP